MRRTALIGLCLQCAGCSFLFVQKPPSQAKPGELPDCTSAAYAPAVDTLGALYFVALAATVELFANVSVDGARAREGVGANGRALQAASLGLAVGEVASAAYGFHQTARCRRIEQAVQLELQRQAPPVPRRSGCTSELDCKAGRLCVQGRCSWPPAP